MVDRIPARYRLRAISSGLLIPPASEVTTLASRLRVQHTLGTFEGGGLGKLLALFSQPGRIGVTIVDLVRITVGVHLRIFSARLEGVRVHHSVEEVP